MAARPDLLEVIKALIHGSGKAGMPRVGSIPEAALNDLWLLNQKYTNPNFRLSEHGVVSRFTNPKDGWSEERIADAISSLLNSTETRGLPNFSGGNRFAKEMLVAPDVPKPIVAPVYPARGDIGLVTIFEESPKRLIQELKKLKGVREGGLSPSTVQPPQFGAGEALLRNPPLPAEAENAVSQRLRLSAVESQSALEDIIRQLTKGVKAVAPIATAGGLVGMLGADEAKAAPWQPSQEPGLETPWFDPVDMLTAPVGVAGAGAKALSAAATPFVSGALNGILSLFGR